MVTVSHVVTRILEDMPFLEEALVRDIINYAYLAEMIKPQVEQEMRKPIKRSAIVMAIRRFRETLKAGTVEALHVDFHESDITVRSGIFEITVVKDRNTVGEVQKLYDIVDIARGDLLTVTQGLYEITILSNTRYKEQIQKLFAKDQTLKVTEGLASLMVKISMRSAESVGVLYVLVKALSWNNVNIAEIVSTLTEEIFIIKEEDTAVAFNAIKGLVKESASYPSK